MLTVLGQEAASSGSLFSTGARSRGILHAEPVAESAQGAWSPPDAFSNQLHHARNEYTPDERGVYDDCDPAADPTPSIRGQRTASAGLQNYRLQRDKDAAREDEKHDGAGDDHDADRDRQAGTDQVLF